MWIPFAIIILSVTKLTKKVNAVPSMFKEEQVIFASDYNITKILVPTDGSMYLLTDNSEVPTIFFTVTDSKLEGGSCIFVLEGFAAYEILEGGRDSTSSHGPDKSIYFGSNNGIYKYNPETLSAKKFGKFNDDIIQIQKANGTDAIFILTSDRKVYKIENNGTVKIRVDAIVCALEFVLDTSNNIYYIACNDKMPHVVNSVGDMQGLMSSVIEEFSDYTLLRPASIMDNFVPFLADGRLFFLYSNGTSQKQDFFIKEKPSAISLDASLYIVVALNGKIYEFNVMDMMIKSMFKVSNSWPHDITRIVMTILETVQENVLNFKSLQM